MAITNSTIAPRHFKHLTAYDRGKIAAFHAAGKTQQKLQIILAVTKAPSPVS